MVSPVSGYGQQSYPISNTFQPGGSSESARQAQTTQTEDVTKTLSSVSTRSEKTAPRSEEITGSSVRDTERTESRSTSSSRGSQLDITA